MLNENNIWTPKYTFIELSDGDRDRRKKKEE